MEAGPLGQFTHLQMRIGPEELNGISHSMIVHILAEVSAGAKADRLRNVELVRVQALRDISDSEVSIQKWFLFLKERIQTLISSTIALVGLLSVLIGGKSHPRFLPESVLEIREKD